MNLQMKLMKILNQMMMNKKFNSYNNRMIRKLLKLQRSFKKIYNFPHKMSKKRKNISKKRRNLINNQMILMKL